MSWPQSKLSDQLLFMGMNPKREKLPNHCLKLPTDQSVKWTLYPITRQTDPHPPLSCALLALHLNGQCQFPELKSSVRARYRRKYRLLLADCPLSEPRGKRDAEEVGIFTLRVGLVSLMESFVICWQMESFRLAEMLMICLSHVWKKSRMIAWVTGKTSHGRRAWSHRRRKRSTGIIPSNTSLMTGLNRD